MHDLPRPYARQLAKEHAEADRQEQARDRLGPLGIADGDVQVHLPGIGGIGPLRPNPRGYAPEASQSPPDPEPMTAQPFDRSGISGSTSAGR
jgi:hypothetical protein